MKRLFSMMVFLTMFVCWMIFNSEVDNRMDAEVTTKQVTESVMVDSTKSDLQHKITK